MAPLLPPLEALERGAFPQIPDDLRHFFREVGGRVRRIDEQVNSQRELLTSILEANLSLISVRQNEVVQAISAWAAIIAVPTFFASIWGMNFEHMPELGLRFGYPLALADDVHRDHVAVPLLQADQVAVDRLLAWLVTGPVGRLVAFVWDLAAALIRGAVTKLGRR